LSAAEATHFIDVIVFNKNRVEEGVPTVLFPAEDAEN
jgi:hypothetical protein